MLTRNPFAELSAFVPPAIMQTYIVAMILIVAGGTLFEQTASVPTQTSGIRDWVCREPIRSRPDFSMRSPPCQHRRNGPQQYPEIR